MSTLASLLQNIKSNLPDKKVDYPFVPTFEREGDNLLDIFEENLLKAGGSFHKVSSIEEAQSIFQNLFPDSKIVCSATNEWKGNKPITEHTTPQDMQDVDVAIVRTHMGVAEMGMVWLTETDFNVPSLGFLCQNIVVLLDPADIVANMHTAYQKADLAHHNYGCFVMGPSATADIGAVLVRGAQGPRTLTVMLLSK